MAFLLVASSILLAVHLHVGFRILEDTRVPRPWNLLGWLCMAALAASVPATLFRQLRLSREHAFLLAFVAYAWLGTVFYLWVFFMARDAWRIALGLVRALRRGASFVLSRGNAAVSGGPEALEDPGRRVFVARAFAAGAALGTLGIGSIGVRSALGEIETPEVSVRLSRLPKMLDGFRIVQLSDLHIGPMLGSRFLRHVVAKTNELRPDLIVITGDLVDGSVAELGASVGLLADLHARHGAYFVTGNHEYYSGCDPWVEYLERLGIPVLMNRRVVIGERGSGASFDLLGVPDRHARRAHPIGPDMRLAAQGRDPERELVVLAHQPIQIAQALPVGAGLQLSGHTHGGQIEPFGELVALTQPYVSGLHRRGDTQIYVSRGTGFWGPPMRVLAPAEITNITLVSG